MLVNFLSYICVRNNIQLCIKFVVTNVTASVKTCSLKPRVLLWVPEMQTCPDTNTQTPPAVLSLNDEMCNNTTIKLTCCNVYSHSAMSSASAGEKREQILCASCVLRWYEHVSKKWNISIHYAVCEHCGSQIKDFRWEDGLKSMPRRDMKHQTQIWRNKKNLEHWWEAGRIRKDFYNKAPDTCYFHYSKACLYMSNSWPRACLTLHTVMGFTYRLKKTVSNLIWISLSYRNGH